jgi:hypothetical protein
MCYREIHFFNIQVLKYDMNVENDKFVNSTAGQT